MNAVSRRSANEEYQSLERVQSVLTAANVKHLPDSMTGEPPLMADKERVVRRDGLAFSLERSIADVRLELLRHPARDPGVLDMEIDRL